MSGFRSRVLKTLPVLIVFLLLYAFGGSRSRRREPEPSSALFFFRVPKTGSELVVLLLQWLQGANGFQHVRLPGSHLRKLDSAQQAVLVDGVRHSLERREVPFVSFDRHVYFMDLRENANLSSAAMEYVSIVRDPVDKIVSRFYYMRATPSSGTAKRTLEDKRTAEAELFWACLNASDPECRFIPGLPYDLTIPYFCGQDPQCMRLNDGWALSEAKRNVEKFAVVGALEELNKTLEVLEDRLPQFFKGVREMYFDELNQPHWNWNRDRPRSVAEIRDILAKNLTSEYDFYHYVLQRLDAQFQSIGTR